MVVGVEPGYMPRGELPQPVPYPAGNTPKLRIIIVHGGDDVGDHLNMHPPLVFGPLGYLQNPSPVSYLGQLLIEGVRKALDINPPGIKIGSNDVQCLGSHIAVGDIDGIEVSFLSQLGGVKGVFKPDGGFVIGPGDTGALVAFSHLYF